MEQVIDKIIAELEDLKATEEFSDVLDVEVDVKLDDPGLVLADEYPYIFVSPVNETPLSETIGRAGYDVQRLEIIIGVVINASDYFDPAVSEASGVRELMKATTLIRKRLRRLKKRNLDNLQGVRNVVVQSTGYEPDLRDNIFVRVAIVTIAVERQYQHED
jgi:hypothetical protein